VLFLQRAVQVELDFTCIGPAVNLAARIEKLTSRLSRTILMSQDFVHNVRQNFVPLGTFSLSGFDARRPSSASAMSESLSATSKVARTFLDDLATPEDD
jgi:adenylate cyclase